MEWFFRRLEIMKDELMREVDEVKIKKGLVMLLDGMDVFGKVLG